MPKTGGFLEPLVFMVVMGLIGASLQAVFSAAGLQPMELDGDAFSLIIMFTLIIVVSGFVASAIYFVIWKLMGSNESFETAYRCNAYISALIPVSTVLNLVPYVAPAISVLLSTVFLVTASIYVHNLPSRRSWLVFGALGLIFMMVSVTGDMALKRLREDTEAQKQREGAEEPVDEIIRGMKEI